MIRFLRNYHDWNCRVSNGKQYSKVDHLKYGLIGVVLLIITLAVLIKAINFLFTVFTGSI
jgi:hypothetical protein